MFGIKNINLKFGFTMAEAIIVMTILGIIATIMITNLKPSEFRDKALEIQAKKILREIDEATQQIMINNTQNEKLDTLYKPGTTEYFNFAIYTLADTLKPLGSLYLKYIGTYVY